jgi:AAA domain
MAISLRSLKKGQDIRPPRITIYGPEGIGKTTMGSEATKPVFMGVEDGFGLLAVDRIQVTNWLEAFEFIKALYEEQHDYRTLVIDTIDWLERFCHAYIRQVYGEKFFVEYGKGTTKASELFEELTRALDTLREKKGMAIVILAHSKVKRFDAPDVVPYERYMLDLHEKAASVIREWSDVLAFYTMKTFTKTTEVGFNKEVVRGISTGEHVLYCEDRPAYSAKNRYNLPQELKMVKGQSFATLRAAIMEGIKASQVQTPVVDVPKTETPPVETPPTAIIETATAA